MGFDKSKVDYSVYLVTDTPLVPEGFTLEHQVAEAVANGATIVQLREKTADTREFIRIAQRIHKITQQYNVPLIINDRVDVALAINAEGVHVGQDDMDIPTLKRLFPGEDKILGVSVNDIEEARQAMRDGVDYVGIGAVYGTATKDVKNPPFGPSGVREILTVLEKECIYDMKTVAIGGVKASNTQLLKYLSNTAGESKMLDGVAVVSGIIAAQNAGAATKEIFEKFRNPGPWVRTLSSSVTNTTDGIRHVAPRLTARIAEVSPLIHHITNGVVKNISANISIAIGASPAMSEVPGEFEDFSKVPNAALLINMGTATVEGVQIFQEAIKYYNAQGRSIVFDPVGGGASTHRRTSVKTILNAGAFDVIKGNEGEIFSAAQIQGTKMQGVDSRGYSELEDCVAACKKLAAENHTTVLMTGERDILVEDKYPHRVAVFNNGHEYLGKITGSGCMLGSLITAFCTIHKDDPFTAAASALLLYSVSAELAIENSPVNGPGSFMPALIDTVYQLATHSQKGDYGWIDRANFQFV